MNGVVHTLGTLLENSQYKQALSEGNLGALVGGFVDGLTGGNPLEKGGPGGFESLNRDSGRKTPFRCLHTRSNHNTALKVCKTFISSISTVRNDGTPRPFVYISAEDVFRPLISARYIETKREAEQGIEEMMLDRPDYRGVYIRPSKYGSSTSMKPS